MTIQPIEWPMCVPPADVAALWHVVRPMIAGAYDRVDEEIPEDTLARLTDGKLLLWVSLRGGEIGAALITALVPRPSGLSCKLMVAAGVGAGEWGAWHRRIESYARAEGCVKLTCEGRVGWSRVLPGYKTQRIVLEKRL